MSYEPEKTELPDGLKPEVLSLMHCLPSLALALRASPMLTVKFYFAKLNENYMLMLKKIIEMYLECTGIR